MTRYLVAVALVFAVNLLPAFGPPTWAVLAFLVLDSSLQPMVLVPLGAVASTAGRITLALVARHFRGRLAPRRRQNLEQLRTTLTANRRRAALGLGVFLLSPLPSSQLFLGAGLLDVPLPPLAAAFFVGRLASYTIYVHGAAWARENFGDVLLEQFRSPLGITLQLLSLVALGALLTVDWRAVLARRRQRGM